MVGRRAAQTLLEAIDASLQSGDAGWLPPASGDDGRTVAPIGTHTPLSPNELEERNDLEVGVKIFLAEKPEAAREACRTVSAFLDARQIDSLVINVSPSLTPSYDEIWDALADCVKCGLVKSLGVAGVSGEELTAFTRRAALKPALVEVSSEDLDFAALQELASEHRFTVRLSQDPAAGPLPSKAVEALTEKHAVALSPDWIARYVVFHNARGVILHVGYLCGLNLTSS
ncbi:hypothetical protein DFJ73DRAFT_779009 [Zopfochytrium polystomum]|nr:hypothetical protein DFJ73DRAFT_779009 [Zopfochytrium polystomum]